MSTTRARHLCPPPVQPDRIGAARHEAAHLVVLLAGAGTFDTARIIEAAPDVWRGEVINPTADIPMLVATLCAGAIADLFSAGHVFDWPSPYVRHLQTAPCCSSDLAQAKKLAPELEYGRPAALDAMYTALVELKRNFDRWLLLTDALAEDKQLTYSELPELPSPSPNFYHAEDVTRP